MERQLKNKEEITKQLVKRLKAEKNYYDKIRNNPWTNELINYFEKSNKQKIKQLNHSFLITKL